MNLLVMVIILFLMTQIACHLIVGPALGGDASGSVSGSVNCLSSADKREARLTFSAFKGTVPIYGSWEIAAIDNLSNATAIIGYMNGGIIEQGKFNLEGTSTSDSICGSNVPSQVTLTGVCGDAGSLEIVSNGVWRGDFQGNIGCTS